MYNLRFKQSKIYKQNSSLTCNKITYMRSYINRKIDLIIKQNPYMFAIKIIQGLSWHDTSKYQHILIICFICVRCKMCNALAIQTHLPCDIEFE
jgi:hypothetical protein